MSSRVLSAEFKRTAAPPAAPVPVIPPDDEVWTREDVAKFLKLDEPNQVYELTRKRNRHPLPVHRVGKQMRFSKAEVIAWFYEKAA